MSGHIPKEFLEQLLQRTDLVGLIDGRVPLRKKSANNYFACCPFHSEKSASFSVSHTKQFYYCFGCGAHGNAIDFMMNYDRLSFPEAVENLAKLIGLAVPHSKNQDKGPSLQHLYALLEKIAQFYNTQLGQNPQALAYFKKRGLSAELIQTFCLGYAPRSELIMQVFGKTPQGRKELEQAGVVSSKEGKAYDRFRERIMFPIQDRRGRFIGFGGRVMDQSEPKYLNSPETPVFQKGHELYGLYQVLKMNRQLPRLLIVEGYMDMLALFEHGIKYAVATLGTATTSYHVQSLFRYTSEIVFCYDGDNAGRRAAWRALEVILPIVPDNIHFKFMFLPEGEDPDSLVRREGKTAFENRIQEAQSLGQYFFHALTQDLDLSTADGKAIYIKAALDQLNKLPDGILKQTLMTELGQKTRTDVKALQKPETAVKQAPRSSAQSKRSSMLRYALTLLVQHPELAQDLGSNLMADETIAGATLFNQVLEMARQSPHLTTGALLESWRGLPEEKWLASLAQQELAISKTGLKAELLGALTQVRKQAQEQDIQKLLEKGAQGLLTPEEKQALTTLIINKKSEKVEEN